jgi:UDP-glucose/iron transport system ATP-binding protein
MIIAENLTVCFGEQVIFENLSFKISKGDKAAIKGESGSGKTTLLNTLLGFVIPDSGSITFLDKKLSEVNIEEFRGKISWVPQELNLPAEKVSDIVSLPFSYKANKNKKPKEEIVRKLIESLGLSHKILQKSVRDISGGEKQRIILASCKMLNKEFIILDEPTSALDKESKKKVIDVFLKDHELTIISASHDDLWLESCNKIINLNKDGN